jgi:hypothetical protein
VEPSSHPHSPLCAQAVELPHLALFVIQLILPVSLLADLILWMIDALLVIGNVVHALQLQIIAKNAQHKAIL